MVHPGSVDTSTVRSVFIVDPDNTLRLMLTAAQVGYSIFATPQHRRTRRGLQAYGAFPSDWGWFARWQSANRNGRCLR